MQTRVVGMRKMKIVRQLDRRHFIQISTGSSNRFFGRKENCQEITKNSELLFNIKF